MSGVPRKRQSMATAVGWTTKAYRETCDYMRGARSTATDAAKRIITAIATHMKHSALVAPVAPRSQPAPAELWRGVQFSVTNPDMPAVGSTVAANGGCFVAFSTRWEVAGDFAKQSSAGGFVYRLQVDRIARGTPWVWFTERYRHNPPLPPRWKNALISEADHEKEVLLPPGFFKVLRVSSGKGDLRVVDIAFIPRPGFVRRGAVPRLNAQGRAVLKTVGGHRLVTDDAVLAQNVRARQERIARGAADKLAGRRPRAPPVSASAFDRRYNANDPAQRRVVSAAEELAGAIKSREIDAKKDLPSFERKMAGILASSGLGGRVVQNQGIAILGAKNSPFRARVEWNDSSGAVRVYLILHHRPADDATALPRGHIMYMSAASRLLSPSQYHAAKKMYPYKYKDVPSSTKLHPR